MKKQSEAPRKESSGDPNFDKTINAFLPKKKKNENSSGKFTLGKPLPMFTPFLRIWKKWQIKYQQPDH